MKIHRILKIFLSCLLIFTFTMPNFVAAVPAAAAGAGAAAGGAEYDWKSQITSADSTWGKNKGDSVIKSTQDVVGIIIRVIRTVAVGIAIIMLTMVAIKYMSSAPGDRAEIKKHAVVYVVGAVVLFASSGILTIIENFAQNVR